MDSSIPVLIVFSCLVTGSIFGAGSSLKHSRDYQTFVEDKSNYYLVDESGKPVSQEPQ